MQSKLTKTIIGAIIAVALAVAVSYGVISQQTADQIRTQADRTLSTDPSAPTAPSQPAPTPQEPGAPTQSRPAQESPAPAARP